MKSKILLISIVILFMSMMCVSASSESSTVQSDIAVNGTSFDDIQHSIDSSSINDTIVLNGNYKSTGSPITISKSLKFQGENNATLDGRKVSGIFNIPKYVNLTFNNINFINSKNSVIAIGTTELSNDFNSATNLDNSSPTSPVSLVLTLSNTSSENLEILF